MISITDPQLFLVTVGALACGFLTPKLWRYLQRRKLFSKPFPSTWQTVLQQRLSIYKKLPQHLQQQLHQEIQLFIFDKKFVGCEGLQITEEIKLLIAAQACLLLINHPTTGYNKLRWIYVYPYSFISKQQIRDDNGIVSNQNSHLLGVSWSNGRVILSWADVENGLNDFTDGHNVTLHEFAHQLDSESGATNGAPLLSKNNNYKTWAMVLSKEFEQLQQLALEQLQLQLQQQQPSTSSNILDTYGATNPAEFFAVATEVFFERPHAMYKNHADLYVQLKAYYQLDPREWQEDNDHK